MDKVKTLGNYSPSEHNASKIVDVDCSAPTVRENHGTVTAIAEGAKRLFNIYGENRGTGFAGNVWDKEANSPSLMTMGGGNRQPMILDGKKEKQINDLRIRKLTPTECFRLQGVKDEDSEKLANMSNSTKYHLAGDSIVTTVLMAIFGELLGYEWKDKVNNLHDSVTRTPE